MTIVFVLGCTADGNEVGSLDGLKLGLVEGLNDDFALGYSLGKEDGSELGELVGIVDDEGANEGQEDGAALRVGRDEG
jgi:hypothetical protein